MKFVETTQALALIHEGLDNHDLSDAAETLLSFLSKHLRSRVVRLPDEVAERHTQLEKQLGA